MPRTLLLGDPSHSWREWLKPHRETRDYVCLDPANPEQTPPGRLTLWRGGKAISWKFYGGLSPLRAPHLLVAAATELLAKANPDCLIHLPDYRPSPLLRQLIQTLAQLARPDEILITNGMKMDQLGFPVGPQVVEIDEAFPPLVRDAQRKAQWLRLHEVGEVHEMNLGSLVLEGSRLGSGTRLTDLSEEILHAEVCGSTLLVVSEKEFEDREVARMLDFAQASRAQFVSPSHYDGLLCAFARQNGEEFGIGYVEKLDFATRSIRVRNTAVAPTPVPILRLGGLRIDARGAELGEYRPWQV